MNSWDPSLLFSVIRIIHGKRSWAMRLIHKGIFWLTVPKIMSGEQVSRYYWYVYNLIYYSFLLKGLHFLLHKTVIRTIVPCYYLIRALFTFNIRESFWMIWQIETSKFKLKCYLFYLFVISKLITCHNLEQKLECCLKYSWWHLWFYATLFWPDDVIKWVMRSRDM